MFDIRLNNAGCTLRKIVDVIKDIVGERKVMFEFGPDGLFLQAVDAARVSIAALTLTPAAFVSFEARGSSRVCVDPGMLLKALKCAAVESESEVVLRWDGLPSAHVVLGTHNGCLFNVPLVEATEDESTRFELPDFEGQLAFDSVEISRYMKDLASFSDSLTLTVEEGSDTLSLQATSEVGMCAMLRLPAKSGRSCETTTGEFSLSYLATLFRASVLSPRVVVEVRCDMPLAIHVPLWDGHGHLRMYLAPKITD